MDGTAAPDAADRQSLSGAAARRDIWPPSVTSVLPPIAILLSTWNGAAFIGPQLVSLTDQANADWCLFWRDDGSVDDTAAQVRRFTAGLDRSCYEVNAPSGHLGVTGSFLTLLKTALAASEALTCFAFADRDDVWLPDKLARGMAALAEAGERPALYCARQVLVDADLQPRGPSLPVRRTPGFPGALTQNIATGCTVMLNRAAAELVSASQPPPLTIHDWWCYLLVSAAGGAVRFDDKPAVLYRQHGANAVGAPSWWGRRAIAALRRGPSHFMAVFRGHVSALYAQSDFLSPENLRLVRQLDAALAHGIWHRLTCLRMPGLRRQTWQETLLFFWWFLLG